VAAPLRIPGVCRHTWRQERRCHHGEEQEQSWN